MACVKEKERNVYGMGGSGMRDAAVLVSRRLASFKLNYLP